MIGVQNVERLLACIGCSKRFGEERFRCKEQGTTVKDTFHFSRGQIKKNSVPRRFSVFLCSETIRERLLRSLRDFLRYVFSCMHFFVAHQARPYTCI